MDYMYAVIFWIGVIYTAATFLLGGVFGIVHIGGHIDTHIDTHVDINSSSPIDSSNTSNVFSVFPLKPITIISFLTVFGGIGMIGQKCGVNWIFLLILSIISGLIVSCLLYRFLVVPLYRAQNTSAISQIKLVGMKAKVISTIVEGGFGIISYVVNGSRYNAPAQHVNKMTVEQGEEVIIYEIKENVFYVQPLNEK